MSDQPTKAPAKSERETSLPPSPGSALDAGDYVLATKYDGGDPQDHWAVGFYAGITAPHYDPHRFNVVDNRGIQFRGNGFRRVEKITPERGEWMLRNARSIELSGMSVWNFATCPMDTPNNKRRCAAEQPKKGTSDV